MNTSYAKAFYNALYACSFIPDHDLREYFFREVARVHDIACQQFEQQKQLVENVEKRMASEIDSNQAPARTHTARRV